MRPFFPKAPLNEIYVRSGLKSLSERVIVRPVRGAVDELKSKVQTIAKDRLPAAAAKTEQLMRRFLMSEDAAVVPIVNATGILAPNGYSLPLADAAVAAMAEIAAGYSLPTPTVEELLVKHSGAEAALVVHSPAVAVMATLAALGGCAVVSRDHVTCVDEISLAEIADFAGTPLYEVGTRGRVSLEEYRGALSSGDAGCLWMARPAAVRVVGDVESVSAEEVFAVARDQQVPTIEYLEAAKLFEIEGCAAARGLPVVAESFSAGVDIVILSGDAFLGGPKCGIILGPAAMISRIAEHLLVQASACDLPRRAALHATLQLAASAERRGSIPAVQLLLATPENLQQRAERLAVQLRDCSIVASAEVKSDTLGYLNEGRLPDQQIPGSCVFISPSNGSAEQLAKTLLNQRPAVAVAVQDNLLIIALQSVLPRQDEQIVAAFQAVSRGESST